MNTDIMTYAPPQDLIEFTQSQLETIKRTVARSVSDDDFRLFIEVCKALRLSPFQRQIYAIQRGDKMTIQTGIDGYRIIAERTGKYAGQLGPFWCGADGVWQEVWLKEEAPIAAKVGVLRRDFAQPLWGVARTKAYRQANNSLWNTMPEVMIAKCAESLALRKAFPSELSGVYTDEEMMQADTPPAHIGRQVVEAEATAATESTDTTDEQTRINAWLTHYHIDTKVLKAFLADNKLSVKAKDISSYLQEPQHQTLIWAKAHLIVPAAITAYMDREELDWPAMWSGIEVDEMAVLDGITAGMPAPAAANEPMATDRQIVSVRKLCQVLGRSEPDSATLTFAQAREMLTQLSREYKEFGRAS